MILRLESRKTLRKLVSKLPRNYLFALLLVLAPPLASAADGVQAVFIKTTCAGKISSAVLSSLRSEISASPKYRLALTLDDEGAMDTVLAVHMKCSEHESVAGIASVFGEAKCVTVKNCHLVVDGLSLRSDLCDSDAAAECGRVLFKALEDYMSNPLTPRLKLH